MKMTKIIKIGDDRIKLDMKDWKKIKNYKIGVYNYYKGKYRYATLRIEGKQYYLHRYILGITDRRFVDHINGDTLDCRRSNLRVCTNQQNQWNAKKKSNSKQEYKCIRYHKGTYEIRIRYGGKSHYKYAKTLEEAKRIYDEWVKEVHGDFAK